jgi:hypothetical protein
MIFPKAEYLPHLPPLRRSAIFNHYLNQPDRTVARFSRDIIHHIHETKKTAKPSRGWRSVTLSKGIRKMLHIDRAGTVQRTNPTNLISPEQAIVLAREVYPNLAGVGILGRRGTGAPINPSHVETAMKFLAPCRKTKKPAVHSFDLRQAIGNGVSQGAVIVACIALGFDARSWMGTQMFVPGAMVNVNKADVAVE